uniref:Senescence domain-containing protein n=2 Tax=Meloidogyne incognita group TaxID=654580 RepID=A0A914MBE7_MELIC
MINSLDVYVQVREPVYYKLLINRIEDGCNMTKTSKIHVSENELPKTAAVSLHGRFKPNGFEGGFVICIQFEPSLKEKGIVAEGVQIVAGGAQMIGKTVIEGAQNVGSAVEEGAKMAVGGVNIVADTVTDGAHFVANTVSGGAHSVVGTVSDGAHFVGGALTSGGKKIAGFAKNASSTIPSGIFRGMSFNKRGKRASSSSSTFSESPKNASKEKSKEKREKNPYKIIAKVLPAFDDGFEKEFLPEEI